MRGGGVEMDGGVGCPFGFDSGLWIPFSRPMGGGREGQQRKWHCEGADD